MTDEELLNRQRIHRASRAREVLDNEEFQAAYGAIEQELTQAWQTSPQRDAEGREKLFQALTMLRRVKLALTETLESGKIARLNLTHANPTMRAQAMDFLSTSS